MDDNIWPNQNFETIILSINIYWIKFNQHDFIDDDV